MRKQSVIIVFSLIVFLLAGIGIVNASTLKILPEDSIWNIGDIFTLNIFGEGFVDTLGGGVNVSWDPDVIMLNNVDITLADPFLSDKGDWSTPGILTNLYAVNFTGFRDDFSFADLSFTAVGVGITPVTLTGVEFNPWGNLTGQEVPVDFSSASVAVVPEPSCLFLIGSGLMGLWGFERRKTRKG